MAIHIPDLIDDLAAETAVLVTALDGLDEAADGGWATPTPADGWTVLDQIAHLAYFDGAVTRAVTDPDGFRTQLADASQRADLVGEIARSSRGRTGAGTLQWFTSARAAMTETFLDAEPAARVPWYGPEMSVGSALTARIMETWAHGQDVFDALGIEHPVTGALRQVAHIGVRALPNSFVTRGLAVPADAVHVELTAPDGTTWVWGNESDENRVTGTATDFGLVVTQRRHVADTGITCTGAVAEEWMCIAQAFAGPPGTGRRPGQFP